MSPPRNLSDLPPPDDPAMDDAPESPTPAQPSRRRRVVRKHRRVRRAAPSSTSSSAAEPRKDKQLDSIQAELDQAFVLIGAAIIPIAPVTGAVFVSKGPQGSDIICNMARRDERILRALLSISKYAVYGELAVFLSTVGIAVAVDVGAQTPDSLIARRLIGQDILTQVYATRSDSNGQNPPSSPGPVEYPNWRGPGPVEVPTGWST